MAKIAMKNPVVEMDGDEMTRVLWQWIKEDLICPYVDLKTEYYDLGLVNRDKTDDQVTVQAAEANKKYRVGVKCATITPNAQRWRSTPQADVEEPQRHHPPHPRRHGVPRAHPRQGHHPVYPRLDQAHRARPSRLRRRVRGRRNAHLAGRQGLPRRRGADGSVKEKLLVQDFAKGRHRAGGAQHGRLHRILRALLLQLRARRQDAPVVRHKDTISKKYDHRFKDIFAEIFEAEYKDKFAAAGIEYMYTLIDDAVARVVRSSGGIVWACKNYDGDVMSDMVATAYGSLGLMSSVLVSPDGNYEFEAAHGTSPATTTSTERRGDLHQLGRDHLRLDGRARQARRAGRHPRADRFRQKAGTGDRLHHRGGRDDGRPHPPLPRRGRCAQKAQLARISARRRLPLISGRPMRIFTSGAAEKTLPPRSYFSCGAFRRRAFYAAYRPKGVSSLAKRADECYTESVKFVK